MWAFIIPILVQLLVSFITELLKDLNPAPAMERGNPTLPDLVQAKIDFMSKVRWRFWLGPKRTQYASALYDRMHAKFAVNLSSSGTLDILKTAKNAVAGLDNLTPADLGDGLRKFSADSAVNFKVLRNGLVQGGIASYMVDAGKGLINYRASIRVGKWFISKTYNSQGTYQVDPTLLNPTNLTVGKVIKLGDLQMRVVSLAQNSALVALTVSGQNATGTAILLTNLPVVTLHSLDATVNVFGMDLVVGVRQDS